MDRHFGVGCETRLMPSSRGRVVLLLVPVIASGCGHDAPDPATLGTATTVRNGERVFIAATSNDLPCDDTSACAFTYFVNGRAYIPDCGDVSQERAAHRGALVAIGPKGDSLREVRAVEGESVEQVLAFEGGTCGEGWYVGRVTDQ